MKKRRWLPLLCLLAMVLGGILAIWKLPWGFARQVSEEEKDLRLQVVHTAEKWLGSNEEDGSHREIIDLYNAYTPLARGYAVSYEDAWCAAFESVVAMECGLTNIIPPECGCDPQIALFQNLGCWEEADNYVPLPGDLIYYHWNCEELGDCSCVTDHVGIVVATAGQLIKVIEGNKDNDVSYRYIKVDAPDIRGYGVPRYGG